MSCYLPKTSWNFSQWRFAQTHWPLWLQWVQWRRKSAQHKCPSKGEEPLQRHNKWPWKGRKSRNTPLGSGCECWLTSGRVSRWRSPRSKRLRIPRSFPSSKRNLESWSKSPWGNKERSSKASKRERSLDDSWPCLGNSHHVPVFLSRTLEPFLFTWQSCGILSNLRKNWTFRSTRWPRLWKAWIFA